MAHSTIARDGGSGNLRAASLRVFGALLAVALVATAFRDVELDRVARLLGALGSKKAVLLLVPSCLAIAFETIAWQHAFVVIGARPSLGTLFGVRVATESTAVFLPIGAVWAETLKPVLLGRHAGLPVPMSLAGMTIRKYLLLASQSAYLVLGFFLGRSALEAGFERAAGIPALAYGTLAVAIGLWVSSEALAAMLRRGAVFQSVLARLALLRQILAPSDHHLEVRPPSTGGPASPAEAVSKSERPRRAASRLRLANRRERQPFSAHKAKFLAVVLAWFPSESVRRWLIRAADAAKNTDGAAAVFFRAPRRVHAALAFPCLLGWLLEATETWLVLNVLGVPIDFGNALAVEALVVLARHVFVILPGGLGAQELGYAAFLTSVASLDQCAAFVALKRLREVVWFCIGVTLLAWMTRRSALPRPEMALPANG